MQKFIARENIKRFRRLLEEEQDADRRKTLRELLKDEEGRLDDLLHEQSERIVDLTSGQPRWNQSRQELQERLRQRSGSAS